MNARKSVVVKHLPERLDTRTAKQFLREVEPFLRSDQPQLVFDLSQVHQMDAAGVDMLVLCLKRALQSDGDLKLSSLSPQSAVVLEMTRIERLFEIHANSADAVRSYSSCIASSMKPSSAHVVPTAASVFPVQEVPLPRLREAQG